MKKQLFFLILMLCTLSLQAQTEHMNFAGIPLTGTIDGFQKQLTAKGFHPQALLNKQLPAGTRSFKGLFAGKDGKVVVYYDTKTKMVYAAKVYFDSMTFDRAKTELDGLKSLLGLKYGEDNIVDGTDESDQATFTVNTQLGLIYCYMMKDALMTNYPYYWSTHVEFNDRANGSAHQSNILDDY